MQQLQMLHQKQLQSVLHHGNNAPAYGGGHSGGYAGSSWHSGGPGHAEGGDGAQSHYKQEETPGQTARLPPAPKQGLQQPPPPPPQPHPTEPQAVPPPPESQVPNPPDISGTTKAREANNKDSSATEDSKSLHLQVLFYICLV